MANINTELEQIRKAVYGREVRGSIANAIELINKEQINTSTAQTNSINLSSTLEIATLKLLPLELRPMEHNLIRLEKD